MEGKLLDEYKRIDKLFSEESALKTNLEKDYSENHETRKCFYCKKKGNLKTECFIWKV